MELSFGQAIKKVKAILDESKKILKNYYFVFIVIIVALILAITLLIWLSILNFSNNSPLSNAILFLSSASTFIVAILTISYVLTSSKQLTEMQKERMFQYQPLPWIVNVKFILKSPKLFSITHKETLANGSEKCSHKQIAILSTLIADYEIKNFGEHPAVCVDIFSEVEIPKIRSFHSIWRRVPILDSKQSISSMEPTKPSDLDSFYFTEDTSGDLIQALISGDEEKYPIFKIRVVYKNVIGGPFFVETAYKLYPTSDKLETLKSWIGIIASFPKQYQKELADITGEIKDCKFFPKTDNLKKIEDHLRTVVISDDIQLSPVEQHGEQYITSATRENYLRLLQFNQYSVTKRVLGHSKEENPSEMDNSIPCIDYVRHQLEIQLPASKKSKTPASSVESKSKKP
jgi:hypothetical protein